MSKFFPSVSPRVVALLLLSFSATASILAEQGPEGASWAQPNYTYVHSPPHHLLSMPRRSDR